MNKRFLGLPLTMGDIILLTLAVSSFAAIVYFVITGYPEILFLDLLK